MKKVETIKRLIILQLSFIGLIFQTAVYAFFWLEAYYPFLRMHRNFRFYFCLLSTSVAADAEEIVFLLLA